jgi:hypothetical protein
MKSPSDAIPEKWEQQEREEGGRERGREREVRFKSAFNPGE